MEYPDAAAENKQGCFSGSPYTMGCIYVGMLVLINIMKMISKQIENQTVCIWALYRVGGQVFRIQGTRAEGSKVQGFRL